MEQEEKYKKNSRYPFLLPRSCVNKGSLHRAAKRGLRRGSGLYIARHDLDRSHTRIMNKQKKKKKKRGGKTLFDKP